MTDKKGVVIVTIDIGDTYSGYAYTYRADFEKDGWKVQMNDAWMREKHATNKTSSTLLLKPHGKADGMLFGYRAEAEYNEKFQDGEHKELMVFKHVKREFYKDEVTTETNITDTNSHKEKLLIDVMSMMLTYMKNQAVDRIKKRFPDLEMKDLRWVITVPALWNNETVSLYRDLLIEAGISHRNLKIVTEQDAAMAYGMRYLRVANDKDTRRISKILATFDAKVMLLDIGGNATTITVHRVGGDKTFKPIFKSRSQNKGGEQVNENFHLLLSNILGGNIMKILENKYYDDYQNMCVEFEMRKRDLRPDTPNHEWFSFTFPYQVVETFKDTHGKKTIHQRITEMSQYSGRVKYESSKFYVEQGVLRDQFFVVLGQIEAYVRSVLKMKTNARTATLLLAGGFSQSLVVQQWIKDRFPEMEVIVPTDPELAIMKGAIMLEINDEIRPPTPEDGNFLMTKEKTMILKQRQSTGIRSGTSRDGRPQSSSGVVTWIQDKFERLQSARQRRDNKASVACEIM